MTCPCWCWPRSPNLDSIWQISPLYLLSLMYFLYCMQPTLKECYVPQSWRWSVSIIYSEFLCRGDLFLLIYLFKKYWFISVQNHWYLFYALGYSLILLQLLLLKGVGQLELFQVKKVIQCPCNIWLPHQQKYFHFFEPFVLSDT